MTATPQTLYVIDVGTTDLAPVRDLLVDDLDGQTFRLVLTWRERQGLWYLDLYTSGGTALLLGAALQPGSPLLLRRQGPEWPGGSLMLHDVDGSGEACTLSGLGTTHELVYWPAAGVAAWRAAQVASSGLIVDHGA